MTSKTESLHQVTREVRACFNRLKAVADGLHADLGVTAALRAIIEFLAENGPHTAPQIARAKGVTRQHIQVSADALADAGFVQFAENPAHKRSQLMTLTDKGQGAFATMRKREAVILNQLSANHEAADLAAAADVLGRLHADLDGLAKASAPED